MSRRIKGINIEFGGDTSSLDNALKGTENNIRDLGQELTEINRALKVDPGNIDMLGQKYRVLGEHVDSATEKLKILKEAEEQIERQLKDGDISQTQYDAYKREVLHAEQALKKLEGQQRETNTSLEEAKDSTEVVIGSMREASQEVLTFADVLKASILGDLIADGIRKIAEGFKELGKFAVDSAIEFESSFADVTKTIDGTDEQINKLRTGFIDLSGEIPKSADEISEVAALAGQLGIEVDAILSFTDVMIGLGEATNLTAEQGATALAQFANVTKMSQEEFDRLGSSVVALGNSLATQESNIVMMGQRLAGAATQAGFAEHEIMALAGAVSSLGISEQIGGTSLSKIIGEIQVAVETTNEELEKFADIAQMSANEFQKAFKEDAAGTFLTFVEGLGDIEASGKSTIAVLEDLEIKEDGLRRVLTGLAGNSELLAEALDTSNIAWKENTALQEEVSERYGTTESQLETIQNRLQNVARSIGEQVLPSIIDLAETFVEFVEGNEEGLVRLSETIVGFVDTIISGAPVIIPMIEGIGAAFLTWKIGGVIEGAMGSLNLLTTSLATATPAVTAFGSATQIAMGPVGWLTLAIGGVTAALSAAKKAGEEYRRKQEEAEQAIINSGEELKNLRQELESTSDKIETVSDLSERWEELNDVLESGVGSSEELKLAQEELLQVEEGLLGISDGIITQHDIEKGHIEDKLELLDRRLELEEELHRVELENRALEYEEENMLGFFEEKLQLKEDLLEAEIEQQEAFIKVSEMQEEYNAILEDTNLTVEQTEGKIHKLYEEFVSLDQVLGGIYSNNPSEFFIQGAKALDEYNDSMGLAKREMLEVDEALLNLTDGMQEVIDSGVLGAEKTKEYQEALDSFIDTLGDSESGLGKVEEAISEVTEETAKLKEQQDSLQVSVDSQIDGLDSLSRAYLHAKDGGEINRTELMNLKAEYPELTALIEENGSEVFANGEIFGKVSNSKRDQSKLNLTAAWEETRESVKAMREQAEAAKQNYKVILEAMKSVQVARSKMRSGHIRSNYGYTPFDANVAEMAALKKEADALNQQADEAEKSLGSIEAAINKIDSLQTKSSSGGKKGGSSRSGGGSGAKSSRAKAAKEEANELFKTEYEIYENKKKFGKLTDEESIKYLDDLVKKTKATGKDLEKVEYEQHKLKENLRKEEEKQVNEFGDSLVEARKRQLNDIRDTEKANMEESAKLIQDIAYEEREVTGDLGDFKIQKIDDEYWAKADAALKEQMLNEDMRDLLDENHISQMENIDIESIEKLRALDEEIDKHWEIILLTNEGLASDLQANKDRLDALDEEERAEREALEEKRNNEREASLQERIDNAKTDEERMSALSDMEDFREELQRKERQKERDSERDKLNKQRVDLRKEAEETINQELADIETIISKQEEGLKRISESVGVEQIEALESKINDYLEDSEEFAAILVNSGEEGQEKALQILETYYPEWKDKGKKFVDYLDDGIYEQLPNMLETAREMGKESAQAFNDGYNSVGILNAVKTHNEEMEAKGLGNVRNSKPVILKTAEVLGVKEPARSRPGPSKEENKQVIFNTENNYSGITAPELPSLVNREQRAERRRLEYSIEGGLA